VKLPQPQLTRRLALQSLASGFGYLAFAGLAHDQAARGQNTSGEGLAIKPTHFPARARRVIFLCMNGGPSHVDLFDHKPKLSDKEGQKTRLAGKCRSTGFAISVQTARRIGTMVFGIASEPGCARRRHLFS